MRWHWVTLVVLGLLLGQGQATWPASLDVQVEQGLVSIRATEVPLGEVLAALSQRAGVRILLDERLAAHPVTVTLEARPVADAVAALVRQAGGGNYAVLPTEVAGSLETFAFTEAAPALPPSLAAPPAPPPAAQEAGETLGGLVGSPVASAPAGGDHHPMAAAPAPAAPPAPAAHQPPRYIPPPTRLGYVPPDGPPAYIPGTTATVSIPVLKEPESVPPRSSGSRP